MKFKENDLIEHQGIIKQIVKAYKNYYLWKYPEIDEVFDSRNSNDFEFYWWKNYKEIIEGDFNKYKEKLIEKI